MSLDVMVQAPPNATQSVRTNYSNVSGISASDIKIIKNDTEAVTT
jgi:hypothetical protein